MKSAMTVMLVALATLLYTPAPAQCKTRPASDYFRLCSRTSPKMNECIKQNIIDLKPMLIKGIPELKLVPLDPMNIPRMELSEGAGNFRFKQILTNLTIYGLGAHQVDDVDYKLDPAVILVKIRMRTPSLRMTAKYVMDGQILVLPIRGEGDCEFNFTDVTTVAHVKGTYVTRDTKQHVDVTEVKWDISVGGAKSRFNNLFNGDVLLGDATNNFLNANWKDAFATYKHLPEQAFGVVFQDLTNRVYKRFPVDELFLD